MNLTEHIKTLLRDHACVTIPRFGAFLKKRNTATIQKEGFMPPRSTVSFNRFLVSNDGLLTKHVAQAQGVSVEQSLRLIEKEVLSWKRKLQTQALIFPGLGEIRLNVSKKMVFAPYENINFDTQSFGMHRFEKKSVAPIKPQTNPTMENKNIMFSLDPNSKKKNPAVRNISLGIAGILVAGAIYYFGDQYIASEQAKQKALSQKQVKSNVQKAVYDLGTLSKIDLNLGAQDAILEEAQVRYTTTPSGQRYYSVIAGSFREPKNAERMTADLIDQGFKAETIALNADGFYRVAYGRFTSKKEALNLLYFINISLKLDAWFLIEN